MPPKLPKVILWGVFKLGKQQWDSIFVELEAYCVTNGLPLPSKNPEYYHDDGWGIILGIPPKLACNFYYFHESNVIRIQHRFTGMGFDA